MKATERTSTVVEWVCDTCKKAYFTSDRAEDCCLCEHCGKRAAVVRERYKDRPPTACASCARSRQRRAWRDSVALLSERIEAREQEIVKLRAEQADLQAKLDAPIQAKSEGAS